MTGLRLKSGRGARNPTPTAVSFGVKTRSGYGGWPSGNAEGSTITGTGFGDWTIDAEGNLVPSGVYGAYKSFGAGSYSLTLANGLPISITMVAARSDIRFRASGDTNTNHQFRAVLAVAGGANGALVKGDSVVVRTSEMQNGTAFKFRPPAPTGGSWTDPASPGVLTVISESVDTSGAKQHGAIFHPLQLETNVSGAIYFPLVFQSVQFRGVTASTVMFRYTSTSNGGWGVCFDDCRAFTTEDGETAATIDAFWLSGGADGNDVYCTNSLFEKLGFAITVKGTSGGGICTGPEVSGNRFNNIWLDRMKISKQDADRPSSAEMVIAYNVSLTPKHRAGNTDHVDFFQTDGLQLSAALEQPFGTFEKNGFLVPIEDGDMNGQGSFNDDNAATNYWTEAIIQNFIYCASSASAVFLNRFNDPTVRYNTLLPNLAVGSGNSQIRIDAGSGGTDGTFTYNVMIALNIPGQGGTVDTTGNVLLAATEGAITTAFPNWSSGSADIETPDDFLFANTPANLAVASGGVVNPGGLVAGALFPVVAPATIGAWNDGTAFDPGNPTWVTAHPPASFTPP